MYPLLERISPRTRKLELFARMHNTHAGYVLLLICCIIITIFLYKASYECFLRDEIIGWTMISRNRLYYLDLNSILVLRF